MRPPPAPEEPGGSQAPPAPSTAAGSPPITIVTAIVTATAIVTVTIVSATIVSATAIVTPPPSSPPPSSPRGAVAAPYHERQRLELCALHALNNVLQRPCFTRRAADAICHRLAPDARLNPHRSLLGTGNYDVNVIMAALQSLGLAAVWWDKRRSLERLALGEILGFILNVPSRLSLGFVALPFRRKHWFAVRQLDGTYYNLDSKLRAPVVIGGEAELRAFLRDFLSRGICEVFLVVPRAAEEAGAWLSPE
ncbi:josephin-2 [Theristicus caerulescens]